MIEARALLNFRFLWPTIQSKGKVGPDRDDVVAVVAVVAENLRTYPKRG